jgi:hypothetical protein
LQILFPSALACPKYRSRARQGNDLVKGKKKKGIASLCPTPHPSKPWKRGWGRPEANLSLLRHPLGLPPPRLPLRSSHSGASLWTSSSTSVGFRTASPHRYSRIASLHRSSINRSRSLNWSFPLSVSLRTSAHGIFCCAFHGPQNSLLCLLVGAILEEMLSSLHPVWAPPALGGGSVFSPCQVLDSETVAHLQRVKLRGEPLLRFGWDEVGLLACLPAVSVECPLLLARHLRL